VDRFLGIVSEFMNPPGGEVGLELLEKIQKWWKVLTISDDKKKQLIGHHGNGVLLTNEFPITAATYTVRRVDNQFEFNAWSNHLDACKFVLFHLDFCLLDYQNAIMTMMVMIAH
jgi:hypothetical protein